MLAPHSSAVFINHHCFSLSLAFLFSKLIRSFFKLIIRRRTQKRKKNPSFRNFWFFNLFFALKQGSIECYFGLGQRISKENISAKGPYRILNQLEGGKKLLGASNEIKILSQKKINKLYLPFLVFYLTLHKLKHVIHPFSPLQSSNNNTNNQTYRIQYTTISRA